MDRQLEILDTGECRRLLASHHFGRLAFIDAVGVLPLLIPVNYLLVNDAVVFRTDRGSKLAAAGRGAPVAFEIDGIDEQRRVGWSVVVRGHAVEVTAESDVAELRRTPLVAWAPGPKEHYVRVEPSQIHGRRVSLADVPSEWCG